MTAKGSHEEDDICLIQAEAEEGPLAGDQSQANPQWVFNRGLLAALPQDLEDLPAPAILQPRMFFPQSWAALRSE